MTARIIQFPRLHRPLPQFAGSGFRLFHARPPHLRIRRVREMAAAKVPPEIISSVCNMSLTDVMAVTGRQP